MEWILFIIIITMLLLLDIGFFRGNILDYKHFFRSLNQIIPFKKALLLSIFYIFTAFIFAFYIYYQYGSIIAKEFVAGYLLEKAMSIDNIFIIIAIFTNFNIKSRYQSKILLLGIVGVIIMRLIFILLGVKLINNAAWIIYIFALFLIFTGVKMLILINKNDKEISSDNVKTSILYKILNKYLNIDLSYDGGNFFIWKHKKHKIDHHNKDKNFKINNIDNKSNNKKTLFATKFFIALLIIESADLIFAIDSIPAILLITQNEFIVYTSNIFAILGLRALYFCLNGLIQKFYYLKHGLSVILIFIGVKSLIHNYFHFKIEMILLIIISIIVISIIFSIIKNQYEKRRKET